MMTMEFHLREVIVQILNQSLKENVFIVSLNVINLYCNILHDSFLPDNEKQNSCTRY